MANRYYPAWPGGESSACSWHAYWRKCDSPCGDPRLLLDEPEAGWILLTSFYCLGVARQRARLGHGVVMALHELNPAARYAGVAAVLWAGQLRRHGHAALASAPVLLSHLYGVPLQRRRWSEGWLIATPPSANAAI